MSGSQHLPCLVQLLFHRNILVYNTKFTSCLPLDIHMQTTLQILYLNQKHSSKPEFLFSITKLEAFFD